MDQDVKGKTSKKQIIRFAMDILIAVVLIALLLSYFSSDRVLYFFGAIWEKSSIGLWLGFVAVLLSVIRGFIFFRNLKDKNERKKTRIWTLIACIYAVFMLCFGIYCYKSWKEMYYVAEIPVDDSRSLVVTEHGYRIVFYEKKGISAKQIGTFSEAIYANSPMIEKGLYSHTVNGDEVTFRFNYGGLADGLTWKDEEKNADPPEYVEKTVRLE